MRSWREFSDLQFAPTFSVKYIENCKINTFFSHMLISRHRQCFTCRSWTRGTNNALAIRSKISIMKAILEMSALMSTILSFVLLYNKQFFFKVKGEEIHVLRVS